MKKLLPVLVTVFILSIVACSKRIPPPPIHKGPHNLVSWRFLVYDSNNRVVDSTADLYFPDSTTVNMMGPNVVSIIPPAAPHDTVHWLKAASFFIIIGPSTLGPNLNNIPVPSGGCAFRSNYLFPSLDRTGWMLQRTENGKRINMFAQIQDRNGYDGKNNDFLYPLYIDGIPYPTGEYSDYVNHSWICDSTQGSCQAGPQ